MKLTPKMVEWLTRLRDSGPAARTRGPVGHRCMVIGLTEWDYRRPDGSAISQSEAKTEYGDMWFDVVITGTMLERITPAGLSALAEQEKAG